jgi:RNA polymerase sigma-70 factor (ECF subfamily)
MPAERDAGRAVATSPDGVGQSTMTKRMHGSSRHSASSTAASRARGSRPVEERFSAPIHLFTRDSEAEPVESDAGAEHAGADSDADADEALGGDDRIQGEAEDSAQPRDEDGVTEGMGTLAINPTSSSTGRLKPLDLERLAKAEAVQAGLHLNGDFGALDDAAIMLELKAGNMAAFDVLIHKYRKPIINFMYRMTRNQAVAEELAQEVFLRVFRSRETYRAEARFSTWLYRIATNLGVNHARDTRHERSASTVYLDEPDQESGSTPDVADQTASVESSMLRNERMAAIREHVMALPERQRMAVLMHKYEGMDYKQIGDVLKLSESATKSLLFRAYQTLREKLKGFV